MFYPTEWLVECVCFIGWTQMPLFSRVFKPDQTILFGLGTGICDVHSPRFTLDATLPTSWQLVSVVASYFICIHRCIMLESVTYKGPAQPMLHSTRPVVLRFNLP